MNELIELRDVSRLIHSADDELRVAILLGYYAGLSSLETTSLRWDDVDLRGGVVRVGRGLGVQVRKIPLHAALQEQLHIYHRERQRGGRKLFASPQAVTRLREKLRALGEPIGLGHVCFRDFQNRFFDMSKVASETCAVYAALAGHDRPRSYILYTKTGRMRNIELSCFRQLIDCFTNLLEDRR